MRTHARICRITNGLIGGAIPARCPKTQRPRDKNHHCRLVCYIMNCHNYLQHYQLNSRPAAITTCTNPSTPVQFASTVCSNSKIKLTSSYCRYRQQLQLHSSWQQLKNQVNKLILQVQAATQKSTARTVSTSSFISSKAHAASTVSNSNFIQVSSNSNINSPHSQ